MIINLTNLLSKNFYCFIWWLSSSKLECFSQRDLIKSAGYIAKCGVASARIRSRVQSRAEPFLFAVSKIDKKFCLGVFLAQKHEFYVFITTPKPLKNDFSQFLCKFSPFYILFNDNSQKRLTLHKNWKKSYFLRFWSNKNFKFVFLGAKILLGKIFYQFWTLQE
jgi:hypothetical protein